MPWFSVLIVTLTILSLSVNPAFSRVVDQSFPPEANEDSIQLIQLTNPFNFSSETSISLQFNFTIGKGVALAIIASDFPSKFGTNMSFEALDAHHFLGIKFYANVFKISYSRDTEVSKTSNVLTDGVKLTSWIEYQATSKQLEVRLSKLDDPKPVEVPLISVPVDLGKMLEGEEVVFGLACSSTRHEPSTSWRLEINEIHEWESYSGDLQDHEIVPFPPFPLEDSSVERYKEKHVFANSGFMVAYECGLVLLSAMVMFFVWSCAVDWFKVQAGGGYKHGTTDASLEMKKNSETAMIK